MESTKTSKAYMPTAQKNCWGTPPALFEKLEEEFGPFDLDAAASASNALCNRYLTQDDDALTQPWTGRVFVNPPYGRGLGQWVEKASEEAASGRAEIVVALLPAHTFLSTKAYHQYVEAPRQETGIPEVRVLPGRLRFVGAENDAPFASMIVVWRGSDSTGGTNDAMDEARTR